MAEKYLLQAEILIDEEKDEWMIIEAFGAKFRPTARAYVKEMREIHPEQQYRLILVTTTYEEIV